MKGETPMGSARPEPPRADDCPAHRLNKGITMSTTTPGTDRTEIPIPPPRKPRKALKVGLGVMTVGLALAIGIDVGASGNHATMAPAAKPAATAPAAPAPATSAPAAPS